MGATGFGSRLTARLARGRAAAESRMGAANGASDAVVRRRVPGGVIDPVAGVRVPGYEIVHDGPMRLTAASSSAGPSRTVTVPGGEVTVAARRADWPASTPRFQDGDVIEITAGESTGTQWLVVEADSADQKTAYRVPVVAHSGS